MSLVYVNPDLLDYIDVVCKVIGGKYGDDILWLFKKNKLVTRTMDQARIKMVVAEIPIKGEVKGLYRIPTNDLSEAISIAKRLKPTATNLFIEKDRLGIRAVRDDYDTVIENTTYVSLINTDEHDRLVSEPDLKLRGRMEVGNDKYLSNILNTLRTANYIKIRRNRKGVYMVHIGEDGNEKTSFSLITEYTRLPRGEYIYKTDLIKDLKLLTRVNGVYKLVIRLGRDENGEQLPIRIDFENGYKATLRYWLAPYNPDY